MSAGGGPLTPAQTADSLPVLVPGPSSAPSGLAWQLKAQPPGQRARAISAVKPGTAYVNPSGKVVPGVPILNIVQPDVGFSNLVSNQIQNSEQDREESNSATPTEAAASAQSEEFAMTSLTPSPDVDPADDFGLMSPSSTEFASSPFDRSMLLSQLGMGSVRQQDDVPPRRSVSLRSKTEKQRDGQATSKRTKAYARSSW